MSLNPGRHWPSCRCCVHWKRLSQARGQCWSAARPIVPVATLEHEACDAFTDQLANRDTVKGWAKLTLSRDAVLPKWTYDWLDKIPKAKP
jgi:hypothetical protein